jgi:deoxycytidylate deaminase
MKGGNVIGITRNTFGGTSNYQSFETPNAHAEINALKSLSYNTISNKRKMSKYTFISYRIKLDNSCNISLDNAKPCYHCTKTLIKYGIKNIIYTDDNGEWVKNKTHKLSNLVMTSGYRKINELN